MAVVVDDVERARLVVRQLQNPPQVLGQLLLVVQVAVALGGGVVARFPGLRSPAVQPHDRQPWRGHGERRRHTALHSLRSVHHHVGQVEIAEQRRRALGQPAGHPGMVPELDGPDALAQAGATRGERGGALPRRREPAGELEQDRAQLSGFAKGLERAEEPAPDFIEQLSREVPSVQPFARRPGKLTPEPVRKAAHVGAVARHEAMRLHVEHEPVRRPARPFHGHGPRGHGVVSGIHLHDRVPGRVVPESVLRVLHAARVEHAPGGERRVGPARHPHVQRCASRRPHARGRGGGHRLKPRTGGADAGIVGRISARWCGRGRLGRGEVRRKRLRWLQRLGQHVRQPSWGVAGEARDQPRLGEIAPVSLGHLRPHRGGIQPRGVEGVGIVGPPQLFQSIVSGCRGAGSAG